MSIICICLKSCCGWKKMRKNNLYNEDCITKLKYLIKQGIKVDAIITDPPYEIGYNNESWDKTSLDWSTLYKLFYKILKPCGNLLIFQGWSNVCNIIHSNKKFILKNWIIYDRIKGRGAKTNLVSTREDLLWFVKGNSYTYNKIPSNIVKKTGGMGIKNGCKYRALSNVWSDISPIVPWSPERVQHPTQKPVALMERCVNIWTNKGDTVLDPFMGSGSTGVACKNLNRKFIGIEINKDYYGIAEERING